MRAGEADCSCEEVARHLFELLDAQMPEEMAARLRRMPSLLRPRQRRSPHPAHPSPLLLRRARSRDSAREDHQPDRGLPPDHSLTPCAGHTGSGAACRRPRRAVPGRVSSAGVGLPGTGAGLSGVAYSAYSASSGCGRPCDGAPRSSDAGCGRLSGGAYRRDSFRPCWEAASSPSSPPGPLECLPSPA